MRLQKNTVLALCSVIEFALHPDRKLAAAEIAERYHVSAHHLTKVLSDLVRAGVVESVRGAGGGYRFAANPRRLTLLDIVERFEPLSPGTAQDGWTRNPAGAALTMMLGEIDAMTRATLASITFATLIRLIERQRTSAPAATKPPSRPGLRAQR